MESFSHLLLCKKLKENRCKKFLQTNSNKEWWELWENIPFWSFFCWNWIFLLIYMITFSSIFYGMLLRKHFSIQKRDLKDSEMKILHWESSIFKEDNLKLFKGFEGVWTRSHKDFDSLRRILGVIRKLRHAKNDLITN